MLNSSRINNSPRTNNTILYNNINETTNGLSRTFIQPKITSTPLVKRESIFATPPKHSILSPRRYSLSEIATPPRTNRRELTKVLNTGPLLATTRYNVNVSTYEDTKSPGLASRIVQYNEETERDREISRPPTHQSKYGSPGLFPVVHLFKKKLPVLEQKKPKVTVRIASPDYSRRHSQEYNRKLLEGIIKPSSPTNRGSPFSSSIQSTSSPRSVLDALKEISRKRIHTNEEYDLNEDSWKRLRTMNEDSNKRLRDDSPLDSSTSPSKPTSKRVCMYDEYAASCSSTDFSFKKAEDPGAKRKSISISTLTDNPKESKQVKLINAETQTATTSEPAENTEPAEKNPNENGQERSESAEGSAEKKKSPLKIFDDAPLERIRKNRLAVLMGSLTGKEPVLLPKPDYASMLSSEEDEINELPSLEVPKSTEKTLVSILSSPKKPSPSKSNKHVHFSVPESTSQTNFSSTSTIPSFPTAPTSVTVMPVTTTVAEANVSFASRTTPAPPSSPVGLQTTANNSVISLPVTTFSNGSNSTSATSIVSKESLGSCVTVASPKTNLPIPTFQFNLPAASSSKTSLVPSVPHISNSSPAPALSSPPKMGGFKFDLSKPAPTSVTSTPSEVSSFAFGGTAQVAAVKVTSDSGTAAITPSNPTFAFGSKSAASTLSSSLSFSPGPVKVTTTSAPQVPTLKFGAASNESKTAEFSISQSNAVAFGVTTSMTTMPAFGTNTSTLVCAPASVPGTALTISKAPFFSFGGSKPAASPSGFGIPATTASAPISFGAPPPTTTVGFGAPASNFPTSTFGAVTTSSTISGGFGSPSASTNPGFSSSAAPMFGANKLASPFAANTTAAPSFGTSSIASSSPFAKGSAATPQFGQITTPSTFGTPTTTVSFGTTNSFSAATTTTTSSSVFGVPNSSSSVFGAKTGGFGPPATNSNIFGGPVNSQPSGFVAAPSKPMFGPTTTSPFGSTPKPTTTPSFGSTAPPSFNFTAKTSSSTFGSANSFGTTTTANTGFGNTTTPSFASSNSFGGGNFGNANAFGASSTPAFGAPTTSSQPGNFGSTTAPNFGISNVADKNSAFGGSSAFGNNISSPFGGPTSTSSFGTPNSTPGFGANSAISAFAKPQANQNAFGAPTSNAFGATPTPNTFGANTGFGGAPSQPPSFGSTNPPTNQNAVFSFGAAAPPKPPGVFSFGTGAPNEVPKPTFNFTGGITAPPAFGNARPPSFGSGGPAPYGAAGIPQFNAPQAAPQGMFSIGSGSSTGKSRTHLKPKRRT